MDKEITKYKIQYSLERGEFTIELEDGRSLRVNNSVLRGAPAEKKWLYVDGLLRDIKE